MLHIAKLKHSRTELSGGWNNHQIIEANNILQLPDQQLIWMESRTKAATTDEGHHVTSTIEHQ